MSTVKIVSDMKELKIINNEMKRCNVILKQLRERKKKIENNILNYLENNEKPGVKYEDLIAVKKDKKQRERKSQTEKKEEAIRLLENNGIRDAENFYKEFIETIKGKEEIISSLKVKEHKE
jgi:hypothetical protein